jgi:hypothetical protein
MYMTFRYVQNREKQNPNFKFLADTLFIVYAGQSSNCKFEEMKIILK